MAYVAAMQEKPTRGVKPRYRRGREPLLTRAQAVFLVLGVVLASELGCVGYIVPLLLWAAR